MLIEYIDPETQSVEAVVELLKFLGSPSNPLPESVDLGSLMLVLSNKRDVYYATTTNSCSCPSAFYRPGQRCKHQRKFFPEPAIGSKLQTMIETLPQADQDLSKMPKRYQAMVLAAKESAEEDPDSIIPKSKWAGGFNGPLEPCEINDREKTTIGIVQNPKSRQDQEA
jgi:hypothetical protein